ncbi:hypothetical protein LUZ62_089765 [Rhynchospora pubera]|uniref:DNA-directed RNA polymerase III subunit n=1 Tax=Rhynchospora pubera TaxID=906938 RepID=A0AAV8CHM9_9POAL|nr:hypothetical protein LUZ62_089765 [Rhynchospora pubera]
MAFRGRGRGRGRFGGGGMDRMPTNFIPYENFPALERLPNAMDVYRLSDPEARNIAFEKSKLEDFWRGSCYHLKEDAFRTKKETDTMGILGKKQKTQERREALASYLKLTPSNFPVELIQGSRRLQPSNKKLKWDRRTDELSFDTLEKLEEKHTDKDGKGEKKKQDEDDEGEEEEREGEAEEESSDDDYNQNIDFDDDEDEYNMEEAAEEEAFD